MTQIDKARLENFLDKQDWYNVAFLLAQESDIGLIHGALRQAFRKGVERGKILEYCENGSSREDMGR